jgi:ribosomal protein S18 acetylase RimI-like enzyme
MIENINVKLFDNSDLENVIKLINLSDHNNREKASWIANKMTAILAFHKTQLIGAIPFEQHKIKTHQNKEVKVLWVSAAYIKPEYRGLGIGSLMDKEIKNFYPDIKYVFVMRHDEGSLAFKWYKKNNYKILSEINSLKININDFDDKLFGNYQVINSSNEIRKISDQLLSSFNNHHNHHFNFPIRTLKSWTDRLKDHYYNKSYKYNLITNNSKSKNINFAVTGLTSIKDNIFRIDILELNCSKDFSEFRDLIASIVNFGNLKKVKEIRVQLSLKDYFNQFFYKLGFSCRWQTNLMSKSLYHETDLNSLNTRFFQVDYI